MSSPAPDSPARKCKQCGRPRKGHPRSGCPFADEPATPTTPTAKPHSTRTLNNAMHGMQVQDVADEKAERRRRRSSFKPVQPAITLESLDSEASRVVRTLAQPGIMSNTPDDTPKGRVSRWRMNIPGEFEDDGTPIPEATSSKPATPKPAAPSRPTTPKAGPSTHKGKGVEIPEPKSLTRLKKAKPLGRTMSMEERDNFLQNMQRNAKAGAQVFTIPRELLADSVKQAQKVGFHAASFWDEKDEDGHIVLGMDKAAVETLAQQATTEGKTGSPLRTGMAGAAAGAVAMLATLAYS